MIQRAYAIHDIKGEIYHLPYYAVNDAVAIRHLANAVQDRNTDVGRNPEDFSLHYTGDYDQERGIHIGQPECPKLIAMAAQFKDQE